jgi:hypothetical protein
MDSGIAMRRAGAGLSALIAALALVVGAAAPAQADAEEQACSYDLDEQWYVCVPLGDDLAAAVEAETGYTIVDSDEELGGRGILVTYSLVSLYTDAGYGGSTVLFTRTSGPCNGVSLSGWSNLGSYGMNDNVSSFVTYSSCTARLWSNANMLGTSYGFTTSTSNLAPVGFNDVASSLQAR